LINDIVTTIAAVIIIITGTATYRRMRIVRFYLMK
jgi:hypothetical protein